MNGLVHIFHPDNIINKSKLVKSYFSVHGKVLDGCGVVEINQVLLKIPHSEVVDCYGAAACVETIFNAVNICNLKMKAFISKSASSC